MQAIETQGITPIDLVAVNLYPFRATAARNGVSQEEVIEQIDIGGPSMLRSAAKNFDAVTVVVEPRDYARVLAALKAEDDDLDLRRLLAEKAFAHTAAYDAAIAAWFAQQRQEKFPETVTLSVEAPSALPPVAADSDKLRGVLTNLVDNAVKYCPEGCTVTLRADPSEGSIPGVRLRVEDKGVVSTV